MDYVQTVHLRFRLPKYQNCRLPLLKLCQKHVPHLSEFRPHQIWSIFTKEREERRRERERSRRKEDKAQKNINSRSRSPLSQVCKRSCQNERDFLVLSGKFSLKMPAHSVAYAAADADFHATLLNAKLAELEKEVIQEDFVTLVKIAS